LLEDGTDPISENLCYFLDMMCMKRSETKHNNPFPSVGFPIGFWLDAAENNAIYVEQDCHTNLKRDILF
jgi:hypothetical protein